jgi:hypothetical protein
MITVGYGDYFAYSHMGRIIAVIIGFFGVFFTSLFVLAITNIFQFDSSEKKAFMLLSRLTFKEELKTQAAGMLGAAYKMKRYAKKGMSDDLILQEQRKYRNHKQAFKKVSKQIRNINDPDADMENLKNGVDMLEEDVKLIKMAQYFVFHDARKLRKKILKYKDK